MEHEGLDLVSSLLLTATVFGCTIQQVAKKAYNRKVSGGTFTFTALSIVFALIVFLISSGGKFDFNSAIILYAIGFALSYSAASIGSFLAISTGPISITSLIVQYSLIIPTLHGLIFLGEFEKKNPIFLFSGLGLLLISLFLVNMEKKGEEKKISLKWIVFAILAFVGNGACSTVQKVQQIEFNKAYKSEFMIIALIISFVVLGANSSSNNSSCVNCSINAVDNAWIKHPPNLALICFSTIVLYFT